MTEAEIRAEWKRPWKCEKCGRILDKAIGIHYHQSIDGLFLDELCEGKLVPHYRRAPDPEKQELVEALRRLVLVGDLIFLTDELEQDGDELILAVAHGQALLRRYEGG